MSSKITEEAKKPNIFTFFDTIVVIWTITMALYLRNRSLLTLIVAGMVTWLYISFRINKKGIVSQTVETFLFKIDKATFPFLDKHPNFPKALVSILFMGLLYIITYSQNMLALFYYALGPFILLLIAFLQTKGIMARTLKRMVSSMKTS